jgi:hypothetical protein
MQLYYFQAIAICVGSGLALAVANALLPSIFTPVFAFGLSVIAFARVFMAPGPLTFKRDLLMFAVILGALTIARLAVGWVCGGTIAASARCTDAYLNTAGFVSTLSAALPIVFFWSWVRFRLLREWIAERRRR